MSQEEAFKMAVSQLTEDVDGKLDRLELEPLKDYFSEFCYSAKLLIITPLIVCRSKAGQSEDSSCYSP